MTLDEKYPRTVLYCPRVFPPTHNRPRRPTTHYCTVSNIMSLDRSLCGTDAACRSNTTRRVAPSLRALYYPLLRGPRSAPALWAGGAGVRTRGGRPPVPLRWLARPQRSGRDDQPLARHGVDLRSPQIGRRARRDGQRLPPHFRRRERLQVPRWCAAASIVTLAC